MLNGDVLTDIDLTRPDRPARGDRRARHARPRRRSTTRSAYGLVRLHEDNVGQRSSSRSRRADQIDTNLISAGAYVLERSVLDLIPPDRNVSIEREVWPAPRRRRPLRLPAATAYWLDIGTPERYLQGTFDILEGNVRTAVRERLGDGFLAVADARVDGPRRPAGRRRARRTIAEGAHVGSLVVLGAGVTVGAAARRSSARRARRARDRRAAAHAARLHRRPRARGSATHASIDGGAVLGEGVTVGADNVLTRGVKVFPGVELPDGAIRF